MRDRMCIQHEPKHGRPQTTAPIRIQGVVLRRGQDGAALLFIVVSAWNFDSLILKCWQVSLPSEDKRNPNVFEFGTSYKDILTKLEERGLDKYHRNPYIFVI
jgi:hypothetical protein